MKIRVTFKDPDWNQETVKEAAQESVEADAPGADPEEKEYLIERRTEQLREALGKWIEWGEYLTVDIDIDAGTAEVIKHK